MKAERYQIIVQGLINKSWSAYFSGLTVNAEPTGLTRIRGTVSDQSALHGLLNKIRDLNLRLISIQLLGPDGVTPIECINCPRNKPTNTSLDG